MLPFWRLLLWMSAEFNYGAAAEHSVPAAPADPQQWMAMVLLAELSNKGNHCIWQAAKIGCRLTCCLPLWVAVLVCLL
jgi:hypothetical protein